MKLREVGDEAQRLKLLLSNLLGVAADDDKDVKVLKALVSLLVGDLGADDDTLLREDLGLRADNGNLKGLGVWRRRGEVISGRGKTHEGVHLECLLRLGRAGFCDLNDGNSNSLL